MSRNWMRTAIQLCVGMMALGSASLAVAAGPPKNTPHPVKVTVADRGGDSILSDGKGIYTDGVDAAGRLWDMMNGVADHLYFQVNQTSGRTLRLTIAGLTSGVETCAAGTLQPNQNDNNYQFYTLLPIGANTNQPDVMDPTRSNFGGTFKCMDSRGRNGWIVTYVTQCIVIAHTALGEWTVTMDPGSLGCPAAVSKVTNGAVTGQGNHDVPFQVHATELP